MRKLKIGDVVVLRAGKDKGRSGKVTKINREANTVIVEGCNIQIKHERGNPQTGTTGGRIQRPGPIHISNVGLADANGKPSRVKIVTQEDGNKVRAFASSGEVVND